LTSAWIFDPHLTEKGVQQAQGRGKELDPLKGDIELVISSPLTRALQTTSHIFSDLHGKVPFTVHPLCREQLTDADDTGHLAASLKAEWPQFDWTHVPEDTLWWYIPDDKYVPGEALEDFRKRFKEVGGWEEPVPHVQERIVEFEAFLLSTQKKRIAVVSHGDYLDIFAGVNLKNAERCMLVISPLKPVDA